MKKRERTYIEFNIALERNSLRLGGFQLSKFTPAEAISAGKNGDKPEAVVLKPEDFYKADFRMLSSTLVGTDSWKCCDFSKADLLKNNMSLFENKPVYTDHATYQVKNNVGFVEKVWWDNAYVLSSGVRVPAGVNGTFAIDITTAEGLKMARSIEMGSVFSVSVGIEFDWVQSHTFEDRWGFADNIGKIQKDGQMCRRIVDNIYNINECSLVHLGADGYAKLLDDKGEIVNPDYGQISIHKALGLSKEDFTENLPTRANNYEISCGFDKSMLGLSKAFDNLDKSKNIIPIMNKEQLCEKMGLDASKYATIEEVLAFLKLQKAGGEKLTELGLSTDTKKDDIVLASVVSTLKDSVELEKGRVLALTTENSTLKLKADKHDARINKIREDAQAKYTASQLAKGLTADETIINLLKDADEDKAIALLKSFGLSFAEALTGKCVKCKSTEISFRSSTDSTEGPDSLDDNDDFFKLLRKKKSEEKHFLDRK